MPSLLIKFSKHCVGKRISPLSIVFTSQSPSNLVSSRNFIVGGIVFWVEDCPPPALCEDGRAEEPPPVELRLFILLFLEEFFRETDVLLLVEDVFFVVLLLILGDP